MRRSRRHACISSALHALEPRLLLSAADAAAALAWAVGPSLPTPLGNASSINTGLGVWVVGGTSNASGSATPTTTHLLDPFANSWSTGPILDQGSNGGALGQTGSNGPLLNGNYKYTSDLFVYGGASSGQASANVTSLGLYPDSENVPAPSLHTARYLFAGTTDPTTGSLYAIGGLNASNQALASVERYDPTTDSWATLASLPQALSRASATPDGLGHILVFGGTAANGALLDTLYSYSLLNNTWSAVGTLPAPASGIAAVYGAYGQIYLLGGKTTAGASSAVYTYDPVLNSFDTQTPLPAPLYGASAALDSNGNLDLVGGFDNIGTPLASLYQSPALPAPTGLPVPPTLSFNYLGFTYNGAPHDALATAYASDGITPVAGTLSYTYNGSPTPPTNAGAYTLLTTFTSADPNYLDTQIVSELDIVAATPVLTLAGGGTIPYDGNPHPLSATALGIDGATPVAGTFSYTYNGSSTPPTNPGTYTALATFTSADSNYTSTSASTTITIPDPTIPVNLHYIPTSPTSVHLTWDAVPNATSYNLYKRTVVHDPKGSGSTTYYTLIASGITAPAVDLTLPQVTTYTLYVTSVGATGIESARSLPIGVEGQVAASLYSILWGGAVMSSATVEVGQTLQVTLLGYGNLAPTYTMNSGPATMSLDPITGVVTYTPTAAEAGYQTASFTASNAAGSMSATFSFHVLARPTVSVTGGTFLYDGNTHAASAVAYGSDGVTPVAGTFTFLYAPASVPTALSSAPYAMPGTYLVQATFTSSDPNYGSATGTATITILPATQLVSMVSRKTVGTAALDLPLASSGSIEPREGGPTQLVFQFSGPILAGPAFAIALNQGTAVATINDSILTLDLSGIADQSTLTVTLSGLVDSSNNLLAPVALSLGVLVGDANLDGRVDLADYDRIFQNIGNPSPNPASGDLRADGNIDLADFDVFFAHVGDTIAPAALVTPTASSPVSQQASIPLGATAIPSPAIRMTAPASLASALQPTFTFVPSILPHARFHDVAFTLQPPTPLLSTSHALSRRFQLQLKWNDPLV